MRRTRTGSVSVFPDFGLPENRRCGHLQKSLKFALQCCYRLLGISGDTSRIGDVESCFTDAVARFPRFEPHSLLKGGHAQTIVASVMRGRRFPYRAKRRRIVLDDGDTVVLHDELPANWTPMSPSVLLVHGLAGNHSSGYMTRVAGKLVEAGVRAFRMDLRACGAGEGESRLPYHAGITQDVLRAVEHVSQLCPVSPLTLAGFSIGGNITLKLLGEHADNLPPQLSRAVVVNPPIDLTVCLKNLAAGSGRFYDRHLAKHLYRQFRRSELLIANAPHVAEAGRPRGMREFDTMYASTIWGFDNVDAYYAEASALPDLANIRVPSLVIASRDDPLVPIASFDALAPHDSLHLHITETGGHLGFIGRAGIDADRRWMDWRIIDWVQVDETAAAAIAA